MDRKVPAVHRVKIDLTQAEQLGVLGYFGDTLVGIVNCSPFPVTFTLVTGPSDTRRVTLDQNETYPVSASTSDLIKRRFMPYVCDQTPPRIDLEAVWML